GWSSRRALRINVYLVAAGITRSGGFQTAELVWGAQAACLRCLAACQTQHRRQAVDDCRQAACTPQSPKNAARFRSRIEFLCRIMIDRSSRFIFAITSAFAASLIFYLAIPSALAAPAEQSPPPVTPTPEAKASP